MQPVKPLSAERRNEGGMNVDDLIRIRPHKAQGNLYHKSGKNDQVDLISSKRFHQLLFKRFLASCHFPENDLACDPGIFCALKCIGLLIIGNDQFNGTGSNDPGLFRIDDRLKICSSA